MTEGLGLIVGSGVDALRLDVEARCRAKTPYGPPSGPVLKARIAGRVVHCIARHGEQGSIPPHSVNYRANLWALHEHGVRLCLAINAVGVIGGDGFEPGELAVPVQLIDYTWGRAASFEEHADGKVRHVEFTEPFDPELRGRLLTAASRGGRVSARGVYGVTQGPRLETAAEIERMARDGCTMVGMTAMPEAVLARELGWRYAICAVGVNHAAGRGSDPAGIHAQLERYLARGMVRAAEVLADLIAAL
jgi:purine nucleoside phosphorylase